MRRVWQDAKLYRVECSKAEVWLIMFMCFCLGGLVSGIICQAVNK